MSGQIAGKLCANFSGNCDKAVQASGDRWFGTPSSCLKFVVTTHNQGAMLAAKLNRGRPQGTTNR
jgi:hypothetical protein